MVNGLPRLRSPRTPSCGERSPSKTLRKSSLFIFLLTAEEQDVPSMASMIFTTIVRTFLRAIIRASADLIRFSIRFIEQGVDVEPAHIHANTMLESTVNQSPISLDFAAKFLEEIDLIMEKILSGIPPRNESTEGRTSQQSGNRE